MTCNKPGVTNMTKDYGDRLFQLDRCAYLRPTIAHCQSFDCEISKKEFMFPFASVVECHSSDLLGKIGQTLVGTAITKDPAFIGN